jgi:aryl-alcohol dehydrogenase-like predicted oxidoreductase
MNVSLGWGTHRVPHIAITAPAIADAGCDWIDTAPNYAHGNAHTELAPLLAVHPEISISTKVGCLPRALAAGALAAGVIDNEAAASGHSIKADYVRWQTERSRRDLGRTRLNVMFLHNPDQFLTDRDELTAALITAFAALEAAACDHVIGGYGVATWTGFAEGAFTVAELLDYATRAAGGHTHHLNTIQLPVSLVNSDPLAAALDGRGPLADAAEAGIQTFISAPLHGGELPALIDQELADLIAPGLTPAQTALAILTGAPGIDRVLISTSNTAHWKDAHRALSTKVSRSTARKVIDVLAA